MRIRLTVRLGTERATLSAVSRQGGFGFALLTHAFVSLGGAVGDRRRHRVPTERGQHHRPLFVRAIGSTDQRGVLCLVRFHRGQPAVAVMGANQNCMGGCPGLAFFSAVGPTTQLLVVGADGTSIDTEDGAPVVVTDDPRFWGRFTDLADAANPVRVFTLDHGHLYEVTQQYPLHVAADARHWWHEFVHPVNGPHEGLGALAAWAADECSLGRQAAAWATLNRLLAQRRLLSPPGAGSRGGRRYVEHLESFLTRTGYAR